MLVMEAFDTMLAGYLLNYQVKDDIAYLANMLDYELPIFNSKEEISEEEFIKRSINKTTPSCLGEAILNS